MTVKFTPAEVEFLAASVRQTTIRGEQSFFVANLLQKIQAYYDEVKLEEQKTEESKPAQTKSARSKS